MNERQNRFFLNYAQIIKLEPRTTTIFALYLSNLNPEGEVSSFKIVGFMVNHISKLKLK